MNKLGKFGIFAAIVVITKKGMSLLIKQALKKEEQNASSAEKKALKDMDTAMVDIKKKDFLLAQFLMGLRVKNLMGKKQKKTILNSSYVFEDRIKEIRSQLPSASKSDVYMSGMMDLVSDVESKSMREEMENAVDSKYHYYLNDLEKSGEIYQRLIDWFIAATKVRQIKAFDLAFSRIDWGE